MITYMVFATKRSGHHAVLNWFCHQSPETVIHFNDLNMDEFNKGHIVGNGVARNFYNVYTSSFKPGVSVVYNWEEAYFSTRKTLMDSKLCKGYAIPIIIIRDFYNMMASSLANPGRMSMERRKNIWKEHAKAALEGHRHIKFDHWVESQDYRNEIADEFGINRGDKGIDYVPGYGGGSSFDKLNYQNKGSQMDVLNRWEKFKNDQRFLSLLDSDVAALNAKLFGVVYKIH